MNNKNTFLPARCRCGAQGYLRPNATVEEGAAGGTSSWRFEVEEYRQPIVPPARSLRVAVHEASHAVVAHVVGAPVAEVVIDGQPYARDLGAPTELGKVAVSLAGPHGESIVHFRREIRPNDDAILEGFAIVRDLNMGGCDRCQAALALFWACGSSASDEVLLSAYRKVEAFVISIIREPRVSSAVQLLAHRLMVEGTILGEEARSLFEETGVGLGSRFIT
jgi:Peptidase M50B-like